MGQLELFSSRNTIFPKPKTNVRFADSACSKNIEIYLVQVFEDIYDGVLTTMVPVPTNNKNMLVSLFWWTLFKKYLPLREET